jgi:hypothetical protein
MSSVRMCDRCGEIFKEGEEGSATYRGQTMRKDVYGNVRAIQETMDVCNKCSSKSVPVRQLESLSTVTDEER